MSKSISTGPRELYLNEIEAFLRAHKINFEHKGTAESDRTYRLASLKHIISNGIYYISDASQTKSGEVIDSIVFVDQISQDLPERNYYFILQNPQIVFYKLCRWLKPKSDPFIHPTAIVENSLVGDNTSIGAYSVLVNCVIGNNCTIQNHVSIRSGVRIGNNVEIQDSSCIGVGGVAWVWDVEGTRIVQPQFGGVVIEDDCFLGSDVSVVRGTLTETTRIGKGTMIAHGTKIGHGCQIGKNVHIANNVSLAGNAFISDSSFLGSGCVVSSDCRVAKGSIVGAGAVVHKSNDIEYATLAGVPAKVIKKNNFESKPRGAPRPFYHGAHNDE